MPQPALLDDDPKPLEEFEADTDGEWYRNNYTHSFICRPCVNRIEHTLDAMDEALAEAKTGHREQYCWYDQGVRHLQDVRGHFACIIRDLKRGNVPSGTECQACGKKET